jgi:hypothetical protein
VARLISRPITVSKVRRRAMWVGLFAETRAREASGRGRRTKEMNVTGRVPCLSDMEPSTRLERGSSLVIEKVGERRGWGRRMVR